MQQAFEPLLSTTDWNEEWKRLQDARKRADDPSVWDQKAKTFPVKHGSQTGYVERFLELAAIEPGESVLDMGCGTGSLATPLALAGHRVIACDFSRGMLAKMAEDQGQLGVTGVEAHLLSWSDDWESAGVGRGSVDVAIASRSIATSDLKDSLLRLSHVARRRACITLPFGPSPRADERLLEAAGLGKRVGRDYLYAFNILAGCGFAPEVAYIASPRLDVFETPEQACESYARMAQDAARGIASAEELAGVPERLAAWLDRELVCDESGWQLAHPRTITWAFIAWNL